MTGTRSSKVASPSGVTRIPRSTRSNRPRAMRACVVRATSTRSCGSDAAGAVCEAYARSTVASARESESEIEAVSGMRANLRRGVVSREGDREGDRDGRKPDRHGSIEVLDGSLYERIITA